MTAAAADEEDELDERVTEWADSDSEIRLRIKTIFRDGEIEQCNMKQGIILQET